MAVKQNVDHSNIRSLSSFILKRPTLNTIAHGGFSSGGSVVTLITLLAKRVVFPVLVTERTSGLATVEVTTSTRGVHVRGVTGESLITRLKVLRALWTNAALEASARGGMVEAI